MKRSKINPWYWLCNIGLIAFCFAAKLLPGSVIPTVFTYLFPILMGIWAAYVLTVIDNYIKPGKDFPIRAYYITAGFMAIIFLFPWTWAKPHEYSVTLGASFGHGALYTLSFMGPFFVMKTFVFRTWASLKNNKS